LADGWSFWAVAIISGLAGGITGAVLQSCFAYLLSSLRERRRERRDLIDLALNWDRVGRPDLLRRAQLSGADLRGARLGRHEGEEGGADLSYALLSRARLSRADLRGATLFEANLRRADLTEANLAEANLAKSDLSGANLRWANLRNADVMVGGLIGATLHGANLRWADLSWADLRRADFEAANLRGAELRGVDLRQAKLDQADLRRANLEWAKVSPEQLGQAISLDGATLPDGSEYAGYPQVQPARQDSVHRDTGQRPAGWGGREPREEGGRFRSFFARRHGRSDGDWRSARTDRRARVRSRVAETPTHPEATALDERRPPNHVDYWPSSGASEPESLTTAVRLGRPLTRRRQRWAVLRGTGMALAFGVIAVLAALLLESDAVIAAAGGMLAFLLTLPLCIRLQVFDVEGSPR
jgi:uncharacterized protein YjbI with pentapeptide repeats